MTANCNIAKAKSVFTDVTSPTSFTFTSIAPLNDRRETLQFFFSFIQFLLLQIAFAFFFFKRFYIQKKSKFYLDCICNIVLYTKIYIYPPDYIFFPLRYLHFIWRETNNLFKQYYFFTLWLPLTTQQFAVIVPHWNVRPAYQS